MTRLLSGAALAVVAGAAILWAPFWLLLALVAVVTGLAMLELCAVAGAAGVTMPRAPAVLAALTISVATGLGGALIGPVVMAVVVAQAMVTLASTAPGMTVLPRAATLVFGPLYVGLPLGALVAVHAAYGPTAVLLLVGVVVASDTAQYYGGRLMGRRLLAPVVSPKKTVEGALTGLLVGTLTMILLGQVVWAAVSLAWLTGLGVAVVCLGIAGDLFESLLKRSGGVKDSSHLIPGHGGVLDRLDALLFAAPVYAVLLPFIVRPS